MIVPSKLLYIHVVYGPPINPVVMEISGQTESRLHVKIYDPNNQRWEIPTK